MNKVKKRLLQLHICIKYILSLILSVFIGKRYSDAWLISERGDEARDNGYEFYKYLREKHKNINTKYVISKKSYDFDKINNDDVVIFGSFAHFLYFLNAKYLISTHHMGYSPEFGMFGKLDDKNLVFCKGKRIFIQHGIIYNYLPSLVGKKIDLFITSSKYERDFIINNFNYNDEIVKCTGLARYDDLIDENRNFILVMPTWRSYLYYCDNDEFLQSKYYQMWNSFFESNKLNEILKKYNTKILFYPHYEIQKRIKSFNIRNDNIIVADSVNYEIHDLLKQCNSFITDYSSTFFDIGYMHKPIIYFHFDYEEFYGQHYEKGYMDIRKDGFGKSCSSVDLVLNELESICERNFKSNDIYIRRENDFYMYNDKKNCERIYDLIKKL